MNNIIIVFDTETTGFSPEKNEIVQLSYILYDVDKQSVLYATKLNDDIVKIINISKNILKPLQQNFTIFCLKCHVD